MFHAVRLFLSAGQEVCQRLLDHVGRCFQSRSIDVLGICVIGRRRGNVDVLQVGKRRGGTRRFALVCEMASMLSIAEPTPAVLFWSRSWPSVMAVVSMFVPVEVLFMISSAEMLMVDETPLSMSRVICPPLDTVEP